MELAWRLSANATREKMRKNGRPQAQGYMIWQLLQTCARMKELTLGIQNHIGFMGLRRRGAELRVSKLLIGNYFKT